MLVKPNGDHEGKWFEPSNTVSHEGKWFEPSNTISHEAKWFEPSNTLSHEAKWFEPSYTVSPERQPVPAGVIIINLHTIFCEYLVTLLHVILWCIAIMLFIYVLICMYYMSTVLRCLTYDLIIFFSIPTPVKIFPPRFKYFHRGLNISTLV